MEGGGVAQLLSPGESAPCSGLHLTSNRPASRALLQSSYIIFNRDDKERILNISPNWPQTCWHNN